MICVILTLHVHVRQLVEEAEPFLVRDKALDLGQVGIFMHSLTGLFVVNFSRARQTSDLWTAVSSSHQKEVCITRLAHHPFTEAYPTVTLSWLQFVAKL